MVLSSVLFAADRQAKTENEFDQALPLAPDTVAVLDSHQVNLDCSADSLPAGYIVSKTKSGQVTYYGRRFNGARTASGEIHHSRALVAAHRTLPFGTRVRVSLADGHSVIVRINDRGPFVRGRDLDLSYGAARQLGMLRRGVMSAKIEILEQPLLALADQGECVKN